MQVSVLLLKKILFNYNTFQLYKNETRILYDADAHAINGVGGYKANRHGSSIL